MSRVWDFILSAIVSVEGFCTEDWHECNYIFVRSVWFLFREKIEREQELKQGELLGGCYGPPVINNECLVVKMERSKQIPSVVWVRLDLPLSSMLGLRENEASVMTSPNTGHVTGWMGDIYWVGGGRKRDRDKVFDFRHDNLGGQETIQRGYKVRAQKEGGSIFNFGDHLHKPRE